MFHVVDIVRSRAVTLDVEIGAIEAGAIISINGRTRQMGSPLQR